MKLTITDYGPLTNEDWLFKLKDNDNHVYFVMNEQFYKEHKIRSPIDKGLLDQANGVKLEAEVQDVCGLNVVVTIKYSIKNNANDD